MKAYENESTNQKSKIFEEKITGPSIFANETLMGSLEVFKNEINSLSLYKLQNNSYILDWYIGSQDDPLDTISVFFTADENKVITDFSGVQRIPQPVLELLAKYGFKEVIE